MQEHQQKWAKLVNNDQKIEVKKVLNKFKSSDNKLNRESLAIVEEVLSRSSKLNNKKRVDSMVESQSDSSVSYPCSNFNSFEPQQNKTRFGVFRAQFSFTQKILTASR